MRPPSLRLVVAGALLAVVAACSSEPTPEERAKMAQLLEEAMQVSITYEVESPDGVKTADITFMTPSGMSQQTGVDVPLTSRETGIPGLQYTVRSGTILAISATIPDGEYGTLTCRIRAGERIISENVASGQYSTAMCSGQA